MKRPVNHTQTPIDHPVCHTSTIGHLQTILACIVLVSLFLATGCATDSRNPKDPSLQIHLAPEGGYELGEVIYRSVNGFEVMSVTGHSDLVGVRYYAVWPADAPTVPTEMMTPLEAVQSLDDDEVVRFEHVLKYFQKLSVEGFEAYVEAFPRVDEFLADSMRKEEDDETCTICPDCNSPPCNEIAMWCLKYCKTPIQE